MLDVVRNFKHSFEFRRNVIDNYTFRLHYQFTTALLCLASALQSAKQYFGTPIQCLVPDKISPDLIHSVCWTQGTFSLDGSQEVRHAWYQWVTFILLLQVKSSSSSRKQNIILCKFQAFFCYLPHLLWKNWEGGKLRLLLQDLDSEILQTDSETTHIKRKVIVNYIFRNIRTHNECMYLSSRK